MSRTILGFDVSSTTTGWCVLKENDGEITFIDAGFIKPLKTTNTSKKALAKAAKKASKKASAKPVKTVSIFKSLMQVKAEVLDIIKKYKPDEIAIEDLIQFMPKKSTARTIITLAIYNRTVGLTCYESLGKEPSLYNVMSIRHLLKLNKEFPAKEEMPALVEKHLKIQFPWVMKTVKKKGIATVITCEESYDVADGIAVALYHAMTT